MRRHDHVVVREKRPFIGLRREDVECRAGELPRLERLDEGVLVDQGAAGGVDDPGAVLHLRDRLTVDHPPRLVGERRVEGEEVGGREHLVLGRRAVDAEVAEAVVADERVVRDHRHPEPDRAPRHLLADPPETEHAERLPFQLHPAPARALPAALLQRRVRLRDVARERHEQPDGLLRRRDDRRLGRVRDDDAVPRRRVDVDVVDAHPRPADHLQARGLLDQLRRQLRRRADHDRVVAADDLLQRRVPVLVDLESRPEQLHARLGDRLADEHAHRHASASYAASAAAPAAPRSTVAPISTSCSSTAPSTATMSNTST